MWTELTPHPDWEERDGKLYTRQNDAEIKARNDAIELSRKRYLGRIDRVIGRWVNRTRYIIGSWIAGGLDDE